LTAHEKKLTDPSAFPDVTNSFILCGNFEVNCKIAPDATMKKIGIILLTGLLITSIYIITSDIRYAGWSKTGVYLPQVPVQQNQPYMTPYNQPYPSPATQTSTTETD
jgi:hypothetical protein